MHIVSLSLYDCVVKCLNLEALVIFLFLCKLQTDSEVLASMTAWVYVCHREVTKINLVTMFSRKPQCAQR